MNVKIKSVINVHTLSYVPVFKTPEIVYVRHVMILAEWRFFDTCVRASFSLPVTKGSSTLLAVFLACEMNRRRGRQSREGGKLGSAPHFISKAGYGSTASLGAAFFVP